MSGRSSEALAKKRKGTGERYSENFKGFVDIDLTEEDREAIQTTLLSKDFHLGEFLQDLTGAGYKFSLAADLQHNSYVATATGKADVCENVGYATSGRGPDAVGSICVLWYKVAVKAHWGSWLDEGRAADSQLPLWR